MYSSLPKWKAENGIPRRHPCQTAPPQAPPFASPEANLLALTLPCLADKSQARRRQQQQQILPTLTPVEKAATRLLSTLTSLVEWAQPTQPAQNTSDLPKAVATVVSAQTAPQCRPPPVAVARNPHPAEPCLLWTTCAQTQAQL